MSERPFYNLSLVTTAIFPFSSLSLETLHTLIEPYIPNTTLFGRSTSRKTEFFAGRIALYFLLKKSGLMASVESHPELGYLHLVNKDGKPIPNTFLNLSHTNGLAVATLSPSPVGIDVEPLDRDVGKVIQKFSTPDELKNAEKVQLKTSDSSIPSPLVIWCAKEAVSKAVGLGIRSGYSQIKIDFQDNSSLHAVKCLIPNSPHTLKHPAVCFEIFNQYLIALCTEKEILNLGIQRTLVDPVLL